MTHISELVKSEISDFCAGLESPGCPETPEEIQRQLMDRILPLIKDARREWMARGVELPEKLPCDVRFEPGLIFRKGVLVQTMLDALIRRDDYEKELAELSEDERKARQEKISEFLNGLGE